MHDLRHVTEHFEEFRTQLGRRGKVPEALSRLEELARSRREGITRVEGLRKERNDASSAMAQIADKKSEEFAARRDSLRSLGAEIKKLEVELGEVESTLQGILAELPNTPDASAPDGGGEEENVVLRVVGEKPEYDFEPKDHVDLGVGLGLLDFEAGAKISGARFVVMRGLGARMERALMQFMLDLHVDEHGYEEVWPPALVKDEALFGTSQLPKFSADLFRIAKDAEWEKENDAGHDLFLCPTAEVPVTNMLAGDIVDGQKLPITMTAFTPCFRSEAGSYGRDTRGMIRQHQFDKVELVRFVRPENGITEHAKLVGHAEEVLKRLGLHYRVVELCTGDLSFAAKKCFDLEVWLPGQSAYREISSCSWFGDFQARRMKARFRPEPKAKPQMLHTINGSGLAIGRTVVAILEQYQQADGSIFIPEALRPYMGGAERISAK